MNMGGVDGRRERVERAVGRWLRLLSLTVSEGTLAKFSTSRMAFDPSSSSRSDASPSNPHIFSILLFAR